MFQHSGTLLKAGGQVLGALECACSFPFHFEAENKIFKNVLFPRGSWSSTFEKLQLFLLFDFKIKVISFK